MNLPTPKIVRITSAVLLLAGTCPMLAHDSHTHGAAGVSPGVKPGGAPGGVSPDGWAPCPPTEPGSIPGETGIGAEAHTVKMPGESLLSPTLARAEQQVRLRRNQAGPWVTLGNAWMQKSRDVANDIGYARAEAAFRKALDLDPSHVPAMLGMAWVCNTRHEFDAGTTWARKVIDLDPSQPDAHALLGDAAVEFGDYPAAFQHYQTCLDLKPDLSSYSRSAHLLYLTGDLQRAQRLMRQAISAGGPYPENRAWCRAQLALMQFQGGALLPAEKTLEDARREAPENPHVLAVSAKLKIARGRYADAIPELEKAASLSPQIPILAELADACRLAGQEAKARSVEDRIHDLQHTPSSPREDAKEGGAHPGEDHVPGQMPGHGHGHGHGHGEGDASWARYLADRGIELDEALHQAEEAHRTFKNIQVTDTLAWCYYKNGRFEEARKTLLEALKWGTPDATLLFHAGMIHVGLGEWTTARKYLYQALSLNPRFHPVHASEAVATLKELAGKPSRPSVQRTARLP